MVFGFGGAVKYLKYGDGGEVEAAKKDGSISTKEFGTLKEDLDRVKKATSKDDLRTIRSEIETK